MKRVVLIAMAAGLAASMAAAAEEVAIEPKEKIVLFDGKTFDGWVCHLRGGLPSSSPCPGSGPGCRQARRGRTT